MVVFTMTILVTADEVAMVVLVVVLMYISFLFARDKKIKKKNDFQISLGATRKKI